MTHPIVTAATAKSAIMYIEEKSDIRGEGRIGRVTCSQTGKTLYYDGRQFRSLKGGGYLANYYDTESRGWYWISNCRKDGLDALYPAVIQIDDDVRAEYWLTIRKRPDMMDQKSFRSEGKYSHRRPR